MTPTQQKKITISYVPPFSYLKTYQVYVHWLNILEKSTSWSKQKRQRYQNNQLQSLIKHAYNTVPYYHNLFRSENINPTDIKTSEDLASIPILTKEIIQKNQESLKSQVYPTAAFYRKKTGGTSDNPLSFYVEKAQWLGIHFAFNTFFMKKAGYRFTDKTISFCGIKTPIKYHRLYRNIECSSFYTHPKDFDNYNHLIHKFKPRFLIAFPSIILLFTKDLIQRNKKIFTRIDGIFCHGEYLSKQDKDFLSETYNCELYDQYGHREQCVFAATSKENDFYQVYPEYGIVELLDKRRNPIHQTGKTGEIISTSLTNHVFPFIRYKTNDLSSFATSPDDQIPHFLSTIQGRTNEFLLGKQNEKIPFTSLRDVLSNPQLFLDEYQIIQEKIGEIHINYVKREGNAHPLINDVSYEIGKILNDRIDFTFHQVDTIPRTSYGKYRYFIQKQDV